MLLGRVVRVGGYTAAALKAEEQRKAADYHWPTHQFRMSFALLPYTIVFVRDVGFSTQHSCC